MLRITTDSAADVPVEWRKEFDIQVIPSNLLFGEQSYLPGVNLDSEGFYRIIEETRQIPKTSPPSPEQFIEFYKKIAAPGDTILSINVSSKLSQTIESARAAAEALKDVFRVIPIDALNGTAAIGILCREARIRERQGKSIEEIIYHVEQLRSKVGVVLTLDTLEYARLSGRVGTLRATLATFLNLKPIIISLEGVLEMAERVRNREDAIERVVQIAKTEAGDQPLVVVVVHARDPQAGKRLMERARELLNVKELVLTELTLSVVANLGPGTVGIAFGPVE